MKKDTPTINDLINGPVIQGDPVLASLIKAADQLPESVFYAFNIMARTIEYMNVSCQKILGYPARDFISHGPDLLYKITSRDKLPELMNKQIHYVRQAKAPGFDPRSIILQEFSLAFCLANRAKPDKEILCVGTILTYTTQADLEFGMTFMVEHNEEAIKKCKTLLTKIKKRHNEIYVHPPFVLHDQVVNLVHVTTERLDKKITARETEVLARLAKGLSTHEIAGEMKISLHTVESHRKNLLQKLHAKNSVELVKKASKVFWLE